jgi:dTDP-4-amino-4,6-dideoxygalactose transaminase
MSKLEIPAFSLGRQIAAHKTALMGALEAVLDQQAFVGGPFVAAFEKQLASYLGSKFVIGCNSGTDALWMALHALRIPKNGIVLTTPFSFIASSSEIAAIGGHPVFIDIEKDTFNLNPQLLAAWLEKNAYFEGKVAIHKATGFPIVGMIPVDLFGQCADYRTLHEIADTWNLWIIEDTAQALGASYGEKKAGTFGSIGAFSFYPTKNLGAFGDAGACVTDDPVLAERLLQVRHHGRRAAGYDYEELGINSRLDGLQAAILSQRLPLLDGLNERRRVIAEHYNKALAGISQLELPKEVAGFHVFHQYTVLVRDAHGASLRGALEQHLANLGIQTRIFYPQSLQQIPFLNTHPALLTACPIANMITACCLSLPMWPEMTDAEVQAVCTGIQSFFVQPATEKHQTL